MTKQATKNQVLSDHRKVGKKFVPPMLQISNVESVSFASQAIPEFLWLATLNRSYGWQQGAELSLSLAFKACESTGINLEEFRKQDGESPKELFATSSAYITLAQEQKLDIVKRLKASFEWELFVEALSPIVSLYPQFPLGFIFEEAVILSNEKDVENLKSIISPLYEKNSKEAVSMYANAIYITFATNKLKAVRGTGFENFPEIQNYPDTEESKMIAASVRASILSILGMSKTPPDWANYFWNRGLEIETC